MFTQKQSQSHEFTAGETLEFEIEWRDENQFVLDKALRVYPASSRRTLDQSKRHLVVEQEPNNLARVAALQRNLHARILFEEDPEQTRKNVLCDCGGRTQAQFTGRLTIVSDELSLSFGN